MALRVAPAESHAERESVYRLRYEIYVRELELPTPEADHRWRRLSDPLDEHARSFVVWDGDEALGCLRVALLRDLPDPVPVLRKLRVLPAQLRFGSRSICLTSRFMLHERVRQSRAVLALMRAAYDYARNNGVRLNFGDCTAHQLPFYQHLGFRSYEAGFNDPAYGFKLPLVMLLGDREGFEAQGTPLGRVVSDYPDDPEVRSWFASVWGHSPYAETAAGTEGAGLRAILRRRFGEEPSTASPVLAGLAVKEVELLLSRSTLFRVREGDRITRRGEPAQSVLLLVSGEAGLLGEGNGMRSVQIGDPIGLGESFWNGRREATVVAASSGEVLAIPGELIEALKRRAPDTLGRLRENLVNFGARQHSTHWPMSTATAAASGAG